MHETLMTEIDGHVLVAVQPEFKATWRAFGYLVTELIPEPDLVEALKQDLNALCEKYLTNVVERAEQAARNRKARPLRSAP
jgi:hypothetical protein